MDFNLIGTLDIFLIFLSNNGNLDFLEIYKKTRAEISRKTHRRMRRDLSYETHLGPKTKMEIDPFSRPLKKMYVFIWELRRDYSELG